MGTGVTKPVWPSREYAVYKVFKACDSLVIMESNKSQAREKIEKFFKDPKYRTPEEIRKIKKLAMAYNLKLQDKRKMFCKKCYSTKLITLGIKNKIKRVKCSDCSHVYRWKI